MIGSAGPQRDMALAACLLAVDPPALGGIVVRYGYGSAIELFVQRVRSLLPAEAPCRRLPLHITDGRLLGGLDLTITLQAGRPVFERGLLAEADGGVLVLPMAERLTPATIARLCSVLDRREVAVERDGFALRNASHLAVIALDEGAADDERPNAALLDRLAVHLILDAGPPVCVGETIFDAEAVAKARSRLPAVVAEDAMLKAFCHAANAVGIASLRAPILAMKVARVHAALSGRDRVNSEDATVGEPPRAGAPRHDAAARRNCVDRRRVRDTRSTGQLRLHIHGFRCGRQQSGAIRGWCFARDRRGGDASRYSRRCPFAAAIGRGRPKAGHFVRSGWPAASVNAAWSAGRDPARRAQGGSTAEYRRDTKGGRAVAVAAATAIRPQRGACSVRRFSPDAVQASQRVGNYFRG